MTKYEILTELKIKLLINIKFFQDSCFIFFTFRKRPLKTLIELRKLRNKNEIKEGYINVYPIHTN